MSESRLYYILCKKHESGAMCTWWAPESNGYRSSLAHAGRYTLAEALLACGGASRFDENVPIPCEVAEAAAHSFVGRDEDRERAWIEAAKRYPMEGATA